jgi:hypothetical protein
MIIKVNWATTLVFSWTTAAEQLDIMKSLVLAVLVSSQVLVQAVVIYSQP